ncbi:MAG: hypothetical protein O3A10_14615 [Chloroflexi bacterium]|nr:hypothetical protein [Chloroflexota bacterium]MDA1147587.1 hypothetical protein [Chloroflexota bacterium]
MLFRLAAIQSELIERVAQAAGEPGGRRRAMVIGAQLGLLWAIVGRVWMRLISDERVFSVPGTIFILVVVSGFGGAAAYAFVARRSPSGSRLRRWWHRLLAYVPFVGMGPFAIFFLGQFALAWRGSRARTGRAVRWLLAAAGAVVTGFWAVIFVATDPSGLGWASALLYLLLGYLIYVSLRFALEPTDRQPSIAAGADLA